MGSRSGFTVGGGCLNTVAGTVWLATDDLNPVSEKMITCDKCGTKFNAQWNGDANHYALCPKVGCNKQFLLIPE